MSIFLNEIQWDTEQDEFKAPSFLQGSVEMQC